MIAIGFLTIIVLSFAVFQIDARALLGSSSVSTRILAGPSTFEQSKSHSNSLKLGRDRTPVCPVRSDAGSTTIGKRQTATFCDGGNCGTNDDNIPTSSTDDDSPKDGENVFSDPDDPLEVSANAASGDQIDGFVNNIVADKPDINEDLNNGKTAEGDVAPDKADLNSLEVMPGVSTVAVLQRPGDGYALKKLQIHRFENTDDSYRRPIDGYPLDGCYEGPNDAYAVHLMEFLTYGIDTSRRWRNPRAILVSDLVMPLDFRYDVTPRGGRLVYRKLRAIFKSGNKIVEIGHYDFRGWLVATEGETKEDALKWFEGIASAPRLLARLSARNRVGEPATTWWAREVLSTMDIYSMDNSAPRYWVPWLEGSASASFEPVGSA